MAKVAIIGAGSIVFCQTLMLDILGTPGLRGHRVRADGARRPTAPRRSRRSPSGSSRTTSCRPRSGRPPTAARRCDGADYVIATFQVGGVQGFEDDYKIPLQVRRRPVHRRHAGARRHLPRPAHASPSMLGMAQDIKEVAPDAYVLNYVNPMATICWALGTTGVQFVGLCHGVQTTLDLISGYVGVPKERDRLPVRGHQPHGLVPEAGAQRRGPLPAAARALRAARVLRQREGARRGLPPLRLLHDRVDRPPLRVCAVVPQEPEGARPLLRRAGLRRRDGRVLQLVQVRRRRSTRARTSSPDQPTALPAALASSTARTSSRRWRRGTHLPAERQRHQRRHDHATCRPTAAPKARSSSTAPACTRPSWATCRRSAPRST